MRGESPTDNRRNEWQKYMTLHNDLNESLIPIQGYQFLKGFLIKVDNLAKSEYWQFS